MVRVFTSMRRESNALRSTIDWALAEVDVVGGEKKTLVNKLKQVRALSSCSPRCGHAHTSLAPHTPCHTMPHHATRRTAGRV
jgi:hypothetical protein